MGGWLAGLARAAGAGRALGALLGGMFVLGVGPGLSGCAVSETDVHRWETTENGPEKLYNIVTHDKFAWPLRAEAALSLVRMRPRNGKRIGLEHLVVGYDTPAGRVQGALAVLSEEARRRIVDDVTPKLVDAMQQPPPPKPADGTATPDPSIPYKDAAFALLSHEPPLAGTEKTKADLLAALTQWVQTDFESRIDNSTQQYGVEQIMRFIGAPSVKTLPSAINEQSTKVDRACALVADIGDDDTKRRAGEALVTLGKRIDSSDWLEKQRALVLEANQKAKITATAQQTNDQLKQYQEQELEKVFANLKRVGGRPSVEYCLAYAHDKAKSEKMRTDALAALENRVDKNVEGDVNLLFDIVKDDTNPDKVRGVAMARLGELPKGMIIPKLYTLFDKKWQVRLDAAQMVLRMITTKDLPDFMRHLPANDKSKMALSEPITYGTLIMAMDPGTGPKPRDALNAFLQSSDLGAKLTAAGSYYTRKKSEAAAVGALVDDRAALPKCDPADQCGWSCDVPKAPGSQDKETKTILTVGEFVRWCIEPSLQ
ncbi:MAG TPA: hypothetical protein VKU41_30370 [Polyangiaceae bacterium]|nr:hypothetical protein [Polyangiaceae bacterium]